MTTIEGTLHVDDEPKKTSEQLERIWAIWSRRKWLAILVFALPFAAATGAILSLPNLYRSTATILVERQQVPEAFVRSTVTSEIETRLQAISQEILSRSRLEGLISRFGLYADRQASAEALVAQMRRDIQVEIKARGRDTVSVVAFALTYRGRDPRTVALVTNTLASFYNEENLKARGRQASGTTEFLKVELAETKKRLDEQERWVSEFKRRHLGELPQQMPANLATLETLNSQLRLNSDNQARASGRREDLAAQLAAADSSPQLLGVAPGLAPGPEPPAIHLTRLRQELTAARARYTDAHPTIVRLKDEIAAVERDLANARPAPKSEAAAPTPPPNPYVLRLREALHAVEIELKVLKTEGERLRSAVATYQSRVENTPKREMEFQEVARDTEYTKELHRSLMKRYEDAQLAESMEQRQKGEQFRVLDTALPSAVTAAPNRQILFLMALAVSLGLAGGAVVLAEMLDTSFHSAAELRAFTRVPVLVRIPRIDTEQDRERRRRGFQLAAAGTLLGLALVFSASYFIAHGNEQMVRMLDRERS